MLRGYARVADKEKENDRYLHASSRIRIESITFRVVLFRYIRAILFVVQKHSFYKDQFNRIIALTRNRVNRLLQC